MQKVGRKGKLDPFLPKNGTSMFYSSMTPQLYELKSNIKRRENVSDFDQKWKKKHWIKAIRCCLIGCDEKIMEDFVAEGKVTVSRSYNERKKNF